MKKNRTMRAATLLLALTLMTSCFVGGTFAKYVTSDTATDTARVAKWGIEVLATGNLFGTDYEVNSAAATADRITATSNNVNSSNTDNIVAPGTKNTEGFTVKMSGTPEVAYKMTANTGDAVKIDGVAQAKNTDIYLGAGSWGVMVKAEGLNAASNIAGLYTKSGDTYTVVAAGTPWTDGEYYELHDAVELDKTYYPLDWEVTHTANANTGAFAEIATTKNLVDIANTMVTNLGKAGNANVDAVGSYKLTWEWAFEQGANDDEKKVHNGADTILGNLMSDEAGGDVVVLSGGNYVQPEAEDLDGVADNNKYCLHVNFAFELAVEQVN